MSGIEDQALGRVLRMNTAVLLAERSGNWLYLTGPEVLGRATPELMVDGQGVELWLNHGNESVDAPVAAVRFPAGWRPGLCWSWAIRNLEKASQGNLVTRPISAESVADHTGRSFEWLQLGGEGSALICHRGSISELVVLRWARTGEIPGGRNGKRPGTHGQAA